MEIKGDILTFEADYIVHQCNCITTDCAGLAKLIFIKYPEANTYKDRKVRSTPGTISLHSTADKKTVVNFYAQYYPGKGRYPKDYADDRLKFFVLCLNELKNKLAFYSDEYYKLLLRGVEDEIEKFKKIKIAFPHKIGCVLGGGQWDKYELLIKEFAKYNTEFDVYIVKKD